MPSPFPDPTPTPITRRRATRIPDLPPVTAVALGFALGAALPQYGIQLPLWILLLAPLLARPIGPWRRPLPPLLLATLAALGAGSLHGSAAASRTARDCRWQLADGAALEATGWVTRIEGERALRVRLDASPVSGAVRASPCAAEVRVRWPARATDPIPGSGMRVELSGTWRAGERPTPGLDPVFAGTLVTEATGTRTLGAAPGLAPALARHRDALAHRIEARFPREAALVQALVVARRGELDPKTRDAFVATGTVHLLAISGFHVGLLAALAVRLLALAVPPGGAAAGGAVLALGYVALLGVPDAALRAGMLLALVAAGRLLARSVLASGALGTALLVLVALDPGIAGRVGAQLSFAGAFGLALGARPLARRMSCGLTGRTTRRLPPSLIDATAAAIAATVATLPLVAWHFERVALLSIPATLVATPFVALALPAVVGALVLDALGLTPAAAALAAGAEGLLGALRVVVENAARIPGASLAAPRPAVVLAAVGALAGLFLARGLVGVGLATRAAAAAALVAAALLLAPHATDWGRQGRMELHMLDVGQGDALALRTPAGRWVLIDAGPPPGIRAARALARLGVRRVELLVLTHPDADHVGGLAHLLETFDVRAVAGPGTVRAGGPWRDALKVARTKGVTWRTLERGMAFAFDGVAVRVLHPASGTDPESAGGDVGGDIINHRSVVLHVEWRGVDVLLTGDAPEAAERLFAPALGPVEVLKVGHHGSRTSTGPDLLDRIRPRVALIPVGRGNRYGHPHPTVLARLEAAGVPVWRTDRDGPLVLTVSGAGEWQVGPTPGF